MSNFIFSGSLNLNTQDDVFWNLKETFLAAGYTVPSSSDGTTWGPGDNLDTAAKLGNNNAWFIIRQPLAAASSTDYGGVQREWAFQRGLASSYWRAAYSYSSSFTGSADAVTLPSALDQVRTIGSEFPAFTYDINRIHTPSAAKVFIGVDTESPWGWYLVLAPNDGSTPDFALMCDPMASGTFPTEDIDPYVFYCDNDPTYTLGWTNAGAAGLLVTVTASILDSSVCWMRKGFSDEKFTGIGILGYQSSDPSISSIDTTIKDGTTNPFTGNDDQLPVIWYRPANGGPAGPRGYKGISAMCRQATSPWRSGINTISTGISGSRDRIAFNGISFPWSGSTP